MKKVFSKIFQLTFLVVFLFYSCFPSFALGLTSNENQTLPVEEQTSTELETQLK